MVPVREDVAASKLTFFLHKFVQLLEVVLLLGIGNDGCRCAVRCKSCRQAIRHVLGDTRHQGGFRSQLQSQGSCQCICLSPPVTDRSMLGFEDHSFQPEQHTLLVAL